MLIPAILFGCAPPESVKGLDTGHQPIPEVTWTAENCNSEPEEPELGVPEGEPVHVSGCPVHFNAETASDGWYLPFHPWPFAICQSDISYQEALDSGILGELGADVSLPPSQAGCIDMVTREPLETGFFLISSGTGTDGYDSSPQVFLINGRGEVDWLLVDHGANWVDCGGKGSYSQVMFGTPFFTPDPRHIECQ